MGKRGRETVVKCESCGRLVRRDKAVFFEKVIFTNPLQRHEVYSETYTPRLTREVAYCPSCGKHLRIYEKKKEQQERQRERDRNFDRRPFSPRPYPRPASQPSKPPAAQPPAASPAQPAAQSGSSGAPQKPASESTG